jgi:hypothetical protein
MSFTECDSYGAVGFSINSCTLEWSWTLTKTSIIFHITLCIFYALTMKWLQNWIEEHDERYRMPVWLKIVRFLHSMLISTLSVGIVVVIFREMLTTGRFDSIHTMVCTKSQNSGIYGIASLSYLFVTVLEWVDSYFLVLTHKEITFLHYFHGMTAFLAAALVQNFPLGGFCFLNCIVSLITRLFCLLPETVSQFSSEPEKMHSGRSVNLVDTWAAVISIITLFQYVAEIGIHSYAKQNATICFDVKAVSNEWWYCQGLLICQCALFVIDYAERYHSNQIRSTKLKKK